MSNISLAFEPLTSAAAGIDESPVLARVTIDRAARGNALDPATLTQLSQAIATAAARDQVRALLLTGTGERAFIGGADIHTMAQLDSASAREFITSLHHCCDALRSFASPVIARINGVAFGAGLELAACADLRIAASHCVFGMPEVRLGIPSVIEAAVLPGLIGLARCQQLLLLGDTIDSATAEQWGLVHKVVAADKLDEGVQHMLDSLLQNGPLAVRDQKALMRQWCELPLSTSVSAGIVAFERSFKTDEPSRMMTAWKNRRR